MLRKKGKIHTKSVKLNFKAFLSCNTSVMNKYIELLLLFFKIFTYFLIFALQYRKKNSYNIKIDLIMAMQISKSLRVKKIYFFNINGICDPF